MLAGLAPWLKSLGSRFRPLKKTVPQDSVSYEQFNFAVAFFVLVICNYVLAEPSPTTQKALNWLLSETSLNVWQVFLVVMSTVSLVTSYSHRWHRIGLAAMFYGGFVWSSVLFVGWAADPIAPAFASAVIYGMFARQAYVIARRGVLE